MSFPNTLTTIGSAALYGLKGLTSMRFSSTVPPNCLGSSNFGGEATFLIYVPMASLNAYKTATNWTYYASRIVGY